MSDKRPGLLKRRVKGVQTETIDKVAAQVAAAESAEVQKYETKHVPLGRIKIWEDQPRTFLLTLDDVYRGSILPDDEDAEIKQDELERLIGLAMSLREFDMLNSPLAYALPGQFVQLLGGQRRTMASILALFHIKTTIGDDDIARHDFVVNDNPNMELLESERIVVKVFNKKPDELTLERISMVDNVQHAELPVSDKLNWLIRFANMKEERGRRVEWRDLVDTMGLSRSQSYALLKVVETRQDPWVQKVLEKVRNEQCALKHLTAISAAEEADREGMYKALFEARPTSDKTKRVSLGVTDNLPALKHLVLSNVSDDDMSRFDSIDWNKPKMVKKAFADFLEYWVEKHG
jgi:hypothetical protein